MLHQSKFFVMFLFIVTLLIVNCSLLIASIPLLIHYQAALFDDSGAAITGTHDITFNLYDGSASETPLWSETHAIDLDSTGVYDVLLGSLTSFEYEGIDFSIPYWLGISIDGGAEMGRNQLGSSPYAFHAVYSEALFSDTHIVVGSDESDITLEIDPGEKSISILDGSSPLTTFGGLDQRVAIQTVNSIATPTIPDNDFSIVGSLPIEVTTESHGVVISCLDCITEPCSTAGFDCSCDSLLTVGIEEVGGPQGELRIVGPPGKLVKLGGGPGGGKVIINGPGENPKVTFEGTETGSELKVNDSEGNTGYKVTTTETSVEKTIGGNGLTPSIIIKDPSGNVIGTQGILGPSSMWSLGGLAGIPGVTMTVREDHVEVVIGNEELLATLKLMNASGNEAIKGEATSTGTDLKVNDSEGNTGYQVTTTETSVENTVGGNGLSYKMIYKDPSGNVIGTQEVSGFSHLWGLSSLAGYDGIKVTVNDGNVEVVIGDEEMLANLKIMFASGNEAITGEATSTGANLKVNDSEGNTGYQVTTTSTSVEKTIGGNGLTPSIIIKDPSGNVIGTQGILGPSSMWSLGGLAGIPGVTMTVQEDHVEVVIGNEELLATLKLMNASGNEAIKGEATSTGANLQVNDAAGNAGIKLTTEGTNVEGTFGGNGMNAMVKVSDEDNLALFKVESVGPSSMTTFGDLGRSGELRIMGLTGPCISAGYGTGDAELTVGAPGSNGFLKVKNDADEEIANIGGGFAAFNATMQVIGNLIVSGTKAFVTPHPNQQDKAIRFICTESPEVMIEYCGIAELEDGYSEANLPKEFTVMTEPGTYRVMATPQGSEDPGRIVAKVTEEGTVEIRSFDGPETLKVAFVVYATRVGYKDHPVVIDKPVSMK